MRILVIGTFRYEMYSPAFVDGFRALGHTVDYIDTYSYCYKGKRDSLLNKLQGKYHVGLPMLRLNRDILAKTKCFKPDMVFFYYCLDVFKSTYLKVKQSGAKVFTYCNDDPFGEFLNKPWNHRFHDSLPIADWNFVYRNKNVVDYNNAGVSSVSVLLPYFLTDKNFPQNKQRDIPIAFMGHYEADGRDSYIKALVDHNIPVTIFGSDWSKSPLFESIKGIIKPGANGDEYNNALNRFQVAIVFLSKKNNDTYTRRCFELPATKTCMLCEYTEDMNKLFPEDECAVYYRDIDEFVTKSKQLVENPSLCKEIGEKSYLRLQEIGGSETDRCKEILQKYEELTIKTI